MNRREKLRKLVSMQGMAYDLNRALEINSLSLANSRELEGLSKSPGWNMLAEQMEKDMVNKAEGIIALSVDPVKNAHEILFNRAVYETLKRITNLVKQTSNKTILLRREQDELIKQKEAVNA